MERHFVVGILGKNVHDYFENNDPHHHLTTETRSGGIKKCCTMAIKYLIWQQEIYKAQGFSMNLPDILDSAIAHLLAKSY